MKKKCPAHRALDYLSGLDKPELKQSILWTCADLPCSSLCSGVGSNHEASRFLASACFAKRNADKNGQQSPIVEQIQGGPLLAAVSHLHTFFSMRFSSPDHVCCVIQETCLLRGTMDMSSLCPWRRYLLNGLPPQEPGPLRPPWAIMGLALVGFPGPSWARL